MRFDPASIFCSNFFLLIFKCLFRNFFSLAASSSIFLEYEEDCQMLELINKINDTFFEGQVIKKVFQTICYSIINNTGLLPNGVCF